MNLKPFILLTLPIKPHFAVGACPYCNRLDTWINNIPLKVYCYGTENDEHPEWEKDIPSPHNPYYDDYNPNAPVTIIEYEDLRTKDLDIKQLT